ncbi:unnamed protein product, partial [Mesorhabditis belari]
LGQQQPCPAGWSQFGKKCFWYSQSVQRTWTNANRYCIDIGGALAGTYDNNDLAFVGNLSANSMYPVWTGLNLKNGYWEFIDGTYIFGLASQWLSGEPLANQGTCGAIRTTNPVGYFNMQCLNVQPFVCNQKIATCDSANQTQRYGVVQSPNFPDQYANNENCIQYITGNQTNFVELIFDAWNVETPYDYVTLYDGNYPSGQWTLLANLTYDPTNITDTTLKPSFQTTSNVMTIRFVTDFSGTRSGWHANYTLKPYLPYVSQSGSSGVLNSPNYPNDYPNDSEQWSYINTLGGTRIVLQFLDFRMEKNRDWLYVYDGGDTSSPLLGNFTGFDIPSQQLLSTNNIMSLFFYTDYSIEAKGFSATWKLM